MSSNLPLIHSMILTNFEVIIYRKLSNLQTLLDLGKHLNQKNTSINCQY